MSTLHAAGIRHRLTLDDIVVITADINYSFVHRVSGVTQLQSRTLKWYADRFPGLLRIHKASLINTRHVHHYFILGGKRPYGYLIMKNGMRLDISRRNISLVKQRLDEESAKRDLLLAEAIKGISCPIIGTMSLSVQGVGLHSM